MSVFISISMRYVIGQSVKDVLGTDTVQLLTHTVVVLTQRPLLAQLSNSTLPVCQLTYIHKYIHRNNSNNNDNDMATYIVDNI